MITRGLELEPPNELIPRIRICAASPPGEPVCEVTVTPGARPCNAAEADTFGRCSIILLLMVETEPVRFPFFWVPYPITTTSFKPAASR